MTVQPEAHEDKTAVRIHVDQALQELLGYAPASDEDLAESLDSIQKLEFLIALEDRLSVPFDDADMAAAWWSSRDAVITYVESVLP